ncbi:DUF2147 domain-containing protein [Sphingomonas piscis]|uniref:DUF2147 domain-containing protein n=1 Tax=Sphingomonas piscis TaxID=2714943 RepID=A0A6G7YPM1_9SPHN|nr:DUF2147 domain-containing protein [Sphingomonas piscis]
MNPAGTVVVEVRQCSKRLYCGRALWASDKALADARHGGTPQLVGTELMRNFAPAGDRRWKGKFFIADRNQTTSGEIKLLNAEQLRVSGCAVGRLLCKSQIWTRTTRR